MKTNVLIYSCDSYSDVWKPFFTLLFRHWTHPFPVFVTCESVKCEFPGVQTLNTQGEWTERISQALEQMDSEYVIGMCEDFFMRRPVKEDIIEQCIEWMDADKSIACFNFEKEYDWILPSEFPNFGQKPSGMHYQKSCQPTLWRRSMLIELLQTPMDAWQWELSSVPSEYRFMIWTGSESDLVFEYGYHNNRWCGIQKGKWVLQDVAPLFEKEGIIVNFTQRGIV